jgi:hypothetical protein
VAPVFLGGLAVLVVTLGAPAVQVLLETLLFSEWGRAAAEQEMQTRGTQELLLLEALAAPEVMEAHAAEDVGAGLTAMVVRPQPPVQVEAEGRAAAVRIVGILQPVVVVVVAAEGVRRILAVQETRGQPQTQRHLTP